jgi:U2 small nuclear ribonucleoprotein B''
VGTQLSAALGPNKSKSALVRYDQAPQAAIAQEAMDGFMLKKGWSMKVSFV